MGIEVVFIDPCPGCENVVPGIVKKGLASSKARTNDKLCEEADAIAEEFQLASEVTGAPHAVAAVLQPEVATVSTSARRPRPVPAPCCIQQDGLCYVHRRYGANAYICMSSSCPMKNQIISPLGNARAGH